MAEVQRQREFPGFKKKSFPISFNGGEIWVEHLDGLYDAEELVIEKLREDYRLFCRPSMTSCICLNLDETTVTDRVLSEICDRLINATKHFTRICFVGTDKKTKKALKTHLCNKGFAFQFIDDFEKAKEWLMSEAVC